MSRSCTGPALFREEQEHRIAGNPAAGRHIPRLRGPVAHDETYMPKEVADALREIGPLHLESPRPVRRHRRRPPDRDAGQEYRQVEKAKGRRRAGISYLPYPGGRRGEEDAACPIALSTSTQGEAEITIMMEQLHRDS